MKWVPARSSSDYEAYVLMQNNNKLLTLSINPRAGTVRIETRQDKRLFMMRMEGFFRSRCVLRNEYGVKIGRLAIQNADPDCGIVELENEVLQYRLQTNGPQPQLIIFRENEDVPLVRCDVVPGRSNGAVQRIRSGMNQVLSGLLMALCWYEVSTLVSKDNPVISYQASA